MIDVIKEKQRVMRLDNKKEKEARNSVLNEIRTLETLDSNVNADKQYKWFKKAYDTRKLSSNIYLKNGKQDLYEKEILEMEYAKEYMNQLESFLPKQLTEDEITKILLDFKQYNLNDFNIQNVMKFFAKEYPNQNKGIVSNIFKKIINT